METYLLEQNTNELECTLGLLPLQYSDNEAVLRELESHVGNLNNDRDFGIGSTYENESYSRLSLKRATAKKCDFIETSYNRAAGTGSYYYDCFFKGCNFNYSNFQYCNFNKSTFATFEGNQCQLEGACFSNSVFSESSFIDIIANGSTFSQCDFSHSIIIDSHIQSCTFEGSSFFKAQLESLDLSNANIEYTDFHAANLQEVKFSLVQFPYLMGILAEDLKEGNITISTNQKKFPLGILPWEEVQRLVELMIQYYKSKNRYFPIINLCLISGRIRGLKEAMPLGMKIALQSRQFKEVKYYARLISRSRLFSSQEMLHIYNDIIGQSSEICDESEALSFTLNHEGEIRHYLRSGNDGEIKINFIAISINTNSDSALKIVTIIKDTYLLFGIELSWSNISIDKNSPEKISLKFFIDKVKFNINSFKDIYDTISKTDIQTRMALVIGIAQVMLGLSEQMSDFDNLNINERLHDQRIIIEKTIHIEQAIIMAEGKVIKSREELKLIEEEINNNRNLHLPDDSLTI